jgi:hypothetical protein
MPTRVAHRERVDEDEAARRGRRNLNSPGRKSRAVAANV